MIFFEIILFFFTCLIVFMTFRKAGSHLFSIISLYCYLFTLMYLCRHLFLMFNLDSPMPDEYYSFDTALVRMYTLLNVFLWALGFYVALFNSKFYTFFVKVFPRTPNVIDDKKLTTINFIMLLFTSFVVISMVATFGFDVSAISYGVRLEKFFSGVSFLVNVNVFCAYFLATTGFKIFIESENRKKGFYKFILISVLSFISIYPSYLMADRDNLVFFAVYYFIGLCLFVSPKFKRLLVPLVLSAIWLIVIMQKIRLANWGYDKEYSSIFRQISSGLNHQFYDSYILLVKGVWNDWFTTEGYRMGEDFLLGLIGVIPRSLWEGKPLMVDPGIWFSNQFLDDAAYGWPISVVGEWWLNFSFIGVLIGGWISGILYKAAQMRYKDFIDNPFAWLVVFMIATRILALGYSTSTPMYTVLNLVPLLLFFVFISKNRYEI